MGQSLEPLLHMTSVTCEPKSSACVQCAAEDRPDGPRSPARARSRVPQRGGPAMGNGQEGLVQPSRGDTAHQGHGAAGLAGQDAAGVQACVSPRQVACPQARSPSTATASSNSQSICVTLRNPAPRSGHSPPQLPAPRPVSVHLPLLDISHKQNWAPDILLRLVPSPGTSLAHQCARWHVHPFHGHMAVQQAD